MPSPGVDVEGVNGGGEARRDADPSSEARRDDTSNPSNPKPQDTQLPAPPGEDDVCFDQAPRDPVGESGRHVWSDRVGEAVGDRMSEGWAVSVPPVNPCSSEDGDSMQDASRSLESPPLAALSTGVCVCVRV